MKIEILGVGTGLCPELGNVSFLVWDDTESRAVLFECGSTVYPSLRKMEVCGGRNIMAKIVAVFVSHGHSDHIGSLDMLLSYRRIVLGQKTVLAGLEPDDFFKLCALDKELFVTKNHTDTFRLYRTEHFPAMDSWACLWNEVILYSGDSGRSMLRTSAAEKAKLIIHEVTLKTIKYRDSCGETDFCVHAGIDDLYQNSTAEIRAKTWLTHYAPQEKDELQLQTKEYGFAGLLEPGQIINF